MYICAYTHVLPVIIMLFVHPHVVPIFIIPTPTCTTCNCCVICTYTHVLPVKIVLLVYLHVLPVIIVLLFGLGLFQGDNGSVCREIHSAQIGVLPTVNGGQPTPPGHR